MNNIDRRNWICAGVTLAAHAVLTLLSGCGASTDDSLAGESSRSGEVDELKSDTEHVKRETIMKVQYLEIVTPDVEGLCKQYAAVHGLTFGEPDMNLGNARTAKLDGGGLVGIRSPMRESEAPVVRPYILVDDIQASVDAAAESGAEIALPPMELKGHGTCAIVIQGGIECGMWQL